MTSSLFVWRDGDEDEFPRCNILKSRFLLEYFYFHLLLMFDVDRPMLSMKGQGVSSNVSRCCSPATRVFFIGSGSTRSLQSNRKYFAPRTALFIRTEFKRHPWNVHRNWKLLAKACWFESVLRISDRGKEKTPPHSLFSILTQTPFSLPLGCG